MNMMIATKTISSTGSKIKLQAKLPDDQNPAKSEFYVNDFRVESSWAVEGQEHSQGLDDLAYMAKRKCGLEVTFQRNVPDQTKPNSIPLRVARGLGRGLATTIVVAATMIGLAAAPFFGISEGVKEYKNSAFKPKPAELSGTLSSQNGQVYFLADGSTAAVNVTEHSRSTDCGGGD